LEKGEKIKGKMKGFIFHFCFKIKLDPTYYHQNIWLGFAPMKPKMGFFQLVCWWVLVHFG
jgi:hypothetical protein